MVKIRKFHVTFVGLLVLSIFSSMCFGSASQVYAQSSRVWSDPINLSNSGSTSNPVIVTDELGVIHAIWYDKDQYMYSRSSDGKEWTPPKEVKFPFEPKGLLPVLVAAPRGFIHVFWQNIEKELVYAQAHSDNLDNPTAWGYRKILTTNVLMFDASVDPQGMVHLAYIRNVNKELSPAKNVKSILSPAGLYYVRSSDEGVSWLNEKLIYESQYFRTAKPEVAHIRIVTSSETGVQKVFLAWDNNSLKRIFISTSVDSGLSWSDVKQVKGPEDTGGYDVPYNAEVSIIGEDVLFLWEVGEPGANQCTLYGQLSKDGGSTWGDPDIILNNRSACPLNVDFIAHGDNLLVALLTYPQGNPALIAWNGTEWSEPQVQNELSFFSNPATNEAILLGCQYHSVKDDQLFLIGCDQGSSEDIWVMSRSILPITTWAFSASLWNLPAQLTTTSQDIPFLIYTADNEYMHALWSQSPLSGDSESVESIYYSRWNGSEWSPALDVIYGLNGTAGPLSVASNKQGRLFLVWSDQKNGDLLFSWANSSKADSSAEWENPLDLPSPSQWTSSPDILVDANGTIVVVYAVPFNEKRGIYMVQSTDNGETWSEPIIVFDADASKLAMVNHPKVALSGDGRLHVLFAYYSGLDDVTDGLYYTQSSDDGVTWSAPDVVVDGAVVWSDMVSLGEKTLHRVWQENDGSVVANIDQESLDGGTNWSKEINITGVSDDVTPVALASNNVGELHFIQLVENSVPSYLQEYSLNIQDSRWDGSQWESQPFQEVNIKGYQARYSLAAGISSKGYISVSLLASYIDPEGEKKDDVYMLGRTLSGIDLSQTPFPAVIASSIVQPVSTDLPVIQTIAPSDSTPMPDLTGNEPSALNKNLAGISLVSFILILVVFIFLRRARRSKR